jgi:hypothetical protein
MSEKPLPKNSGSISMGAVGLALTIISIIGIVRFPVVAAVFLGGALGAVGLVLSIVGIVKGSGRAAGVFAIFIFLLGCLMMFSLVLDIIAYLRAHSG